MGALRIFNVFLKYLVFYKFNQHSGKIFGKRVRQACEELGTTFIKFGQMLSTRYDILLREDCDELQKLLNNVKPIPFVKVKEIFKHDFGAYPEELFLEFSEIPVASASISQVHKAKLFSGEEVAVKIRRPYIGKIIEKDMNTLIRLARFSKVFSWRLRLLNVSAIMKEMKKWMLKEIDFENEKENLLKIKKLYSFCDEKYFKHYVGRGYFPKPYEEWCSKNVITMDYIDGVALINLDKIKGDLSYDIYNSLKGYFGCTIYALFNCKNFILQADPHPANMLVLKNGDCANVDCGMVLELKPYELKKINDLFISIFLRDLKRTVNMVLDLCGKDRKYFGKLVFDVREYLERTEFEDVGFWFIELFKISLNHKMRFPEYFVAFGRSVIVFDGTIKSFDESINTLEMIGEELRDEAKKRIWNNIRDIDYKMVLYNLTEKLRESPRFASSLVDRYCGSPKRIVYDIKSIISSLVG